MKRDYIFISIAAMFLVLFFGIFFRGQILSSEIEARALNKFPELNYQDFKNTNYQNQLEAAIADQLIFSENLKRNYLDYSDRFGSQIWKLFFFDKKNYTQISKDFFTYNEDDYLVKKQLVLENIIDNLEINKNYFNSSYDKNIKRYIFLAESDITFDFNSNNDIFYNYIKENYKYDKISRFSFSNYEEYKKYFFKSDHHWNYEGSYKGYTEIIKLLFLNTENTLKPIKKVEFDSISFNGASARVIANQNYKDDFIAYKFEESEHLEFINGVQGTYGKYNTYFKGEYELEGWKNYYADLYGGDYAEIIFDYNNEKKDNLLVISNSFANPIKPLIASHFNKTHFIDLRHYKNTFQEDFNMNEYITKNSINKVLILGNLSLYYKDKFGQGE